MAVKAPIGDGGYELVEAIIDSGEPLELAIDFPGVPAGTVLVKGEDGLYWAEKEAFWCSEEFVRAAPEKLNVAEKAQPIGD